MKLVERLASLLSHSTKRAAPQAGRKKPVP